MMRRAARVHGLRMLGLAILIALAAWGGIEGYGNLRAAALVESLKTASTTGVPTLIEQLRGYRRWAARPLASLLASTESQSDPHLRASLASLALWPDDGRPADTLFDRLLGASAVDLPVICGILRQHRPGIDQQLWPVLEDTQSDSARRFRAGCALASASAGSDPIDPRWDKVAPFLTDHFLTAAIENPGDYAPLLETLRPIRKGLLAPLSRVFTDPGRSQSEHNLATSLLLDYARDVPDLLADLLMDADPRAYARLFPAAEQQAARALPIFQAELLKTADPDWNDRPLEPTWAKPDPALASRIESAQGLVADRFAFCQAMPLEEFRPVAEELWKSGYRPVRLRPYADGSTVQVAAVWARDGRNWRLALDLTADQIPGPAEGAKSVPVDVAGYVATGQDGKPVDRYAILWVERTGPEEGARLYAGLVATEQRAEHQRLEAGRMVPVTLQAWRAADGRTRFCGVWRPPSATQAPPYHERLTENQVADELAQYAKDTLVDLSVVRAEPPPGTQDRAARALKAAEAAVKANPSSLNARLARATALIRLGEDHKALDDLNTVLEKAPQFADALWSRALVHARLGRKTDALEDLAKFDKETATESTRLCLAVVVAANLGEGRDEALAKLEAALKRQPNDPGLYYDAACAFAAAGQALARTDRPRSARDAGRAIALLQAAIGLGYSDYDRIQDESDLDFIRDLPAFAELMKAGRLDRGYTAVWSAGPRFEAIPTYGIDPMAQLRESQTLIAQGYRPVAMSVSRTAPQTALVTAAVWHRPVVPEDAKDRLAERQARAAIALVRLGHAEDVWPLLRHSADPRLRSFLVNWLSPLGAEPTAIITALAPRDSATTHHSPPVNTMDTVLFHPETSIRRALILALGTYGTDAIAPAELEPFLAKLLDLYRHDPDSGIHGAAEWTLRQWKQEARIEAADAELSRLKDRGRRRWFVNRRKQSFAIIEGPVAFRMGSPPTEPDREADETPHSRVIPYRFALATKEVSVAQYQEFVKDHPEFGPAQHYLDKFSPRPDGPMLGRSWFGATAYCNWLSEQDGLPPDQWCYERNERGEFAKGMKIPGNASRRAGYRLPTEAEWEYAARAGALSSRPYGHSPALLGRYAWFAGNSQDHAWPCGSLEPNDLGLFDMLGNVFEWCQGRGVKYQPGRPEPSTSDIVDDLPRLVRGGAFTYRPANVRSAYRNKGAPSDPFLLIGFRLARSYD
jgi:formylglycine-generating enzyme required for sulfatase activity/tetratricopeptide (TPR) repeat protein